MKHIEGLREGFSSYTDNEKNIHCDAKYDVRYLPSGSRIPAKH